ncbi:hypothetical protein SpCBS45565_g04551 [Spizellomyces sp. 'palustris']|nr:hypothetical protein SpCBS45565_g04551 [Spizellomyces sp. 'palustris']
MSLRYRQQKPETNMLDERSGLLDGKAYDKRRGAQWFGWQHFIVFPLLIGALCFISGSRRSLINEYSLPSYYIIYNARVYTVDDVQLIAEAFVVRDGLFVDVGSGTELRQAYPDAKAVDVGGRMIVPGLIDAHAHLIEQGLALLQADVTGAITLSQVRSRLVSYLDAHPDIESNKEWIIGKGWDQTKWPETNHQFPNASDLDHPRLRHIPICLFRIDYHAFWVNAAALEKIGNVPKTVDGGEIVRDSNGRLTGVFVDNAMDIVDKAMERPGEKRLGEAIEAVTQRMVGYGLTGLHDAGVLPWQLDFLKSIVDAGRLPIRNYAMIKCPDPAQYCGDMVPQLFNYGDRLTVRSVKLFLDGAVGSWGAAMIEPYSDDPTKSGFLRMNETDLPDLVWKWIRSGYQVNTHCIGDLANKITLDAYERAFERLGDQGKDLRLRIEHAQLVRLEDIPRFARLGVVPSMQPTHATSDMSYVERRIGPNRVRGAYAWQSLLNAGVSHIPLGSDFPIEGINPLLGIYAAVTRTDVNGSSPHGPNGWYPSQKLNRTQALKGFTLDAAWAAFQDSELGSIAPSKKADFVVFDTDFMKDDLPPSKILEAKVVTTVVGGNVVYGMLGGFTT